MSEYLFKTDKEIKTCNECPMSEHLKIENCYYCKLLHDIAENNTKISDCPLKEVPTHGDLIDRQKLLEHRFEVYDSNEEVCEDYIETYHVLEASAIIEASKERE